jgi:hypothetical protein
MYSHAILKRFVKDYSLPIQVLREPYFEYFIDLYDKTHRTKEKYKLLADTVDKLGGEDNFFIEYNRIKEAFLDTIKSTEIYNKFNNESLDRFNIPQFNYSKNDVFNLGKIDKYFVSVDLKKANFQAMKYFDKDLVLGFDTYDNLMKQFTNLEYMINSKYIRQVLFGNMNPKRQIKIEQYLIYQILQLLLRYGFTVDRAIKMVSPDEIVFEVSQNYLDENVYLDIDITDIVHDELNLSIDVEIYQLDNIKPYKFFVKEFINKPGEELMCVPIVYYPQVYKRYYDLELNNSDLCFFYENQVAQFIKPLDFDNEVNFSEDTTD